MADLADAGWRAALAQVTLHLTAPGVPDIYQGGELWDLALVDPDNRRPVDYDVRRRLLDEAGDLGPAAAWERRDGGMPKLWLHRRLLELRARRPEAFAPGAAYEPIEPTAPLPTSVAVPSWSPSRWFPSQRRPTSS